MDGWGTAEEGGEAAGSGQAGDSPSWAAVAPRAPAQARGAGGKDWGLHKGRSWARKMETRGCGLTALLRPRLAATLTLRRGRHLCPRLWGWGRKAGREVTTPGPHGWAAVLAPGSGRGTRDPSESEDAHAVGHRADGQTDGSRHPQRGTTTSHLLPPGHSDLSVLRDGDTSQPTPQGHPARNAVGNQRGQQSGAARPRGAVPPAALGLSGGLLPAGHESC